MNVSPLCAANVPNTMPNAVWLSTIGVIATAPSNRPVRVKVGVCEGGVMSGRLSVRNVRERCQRGEFSSTDRTGHARKLRTVGGSQRFVSGMRRADASTQGAPDGGAHTVRD